MKLNLKIDDEKMVRLRHKFYPVSVSGEKIPCLAIGMGTLMQRTLSPRFKKHFKVYSSDLYWDSRYAIENPESLTMERILEDIAKLGEALKLERFVLLAHSCFGIAGLEFVKKFPYFLRGIICIGTPPEWNENITQGNEEYFKSHADEERKRIDAQRRLEFAKENRRSWDPTTRFLREYVWRDAPRYWHDPVFDCSSLWEGVQIDRLFDHYLWNILPKNAIERGLERISCPVFLAAGDSDYDCCPLQLWAKIKDRPPKMRISRFEKSGHYPNYEEQDLFDERVEDWLDKL